ncbi:hypothetical protein C8J57DRAFT_1336959 [Mycena rebaudengoi]|nr:hypothetical protein C8J57DRAFT_1336959 [Mycena rebaudengoi]
MRYLISCPCYTTITMPPSVAAQGPPKSIFPEDVERAINDVLLSEARDMCGTMARVASRFYAWTKPIAFHTVVVRRHNNWTRRISDLLLPNVRFIRVLAIDLRGTREGLSDEELSHIRQLLEASVQHVRHLAVVWSIWARLHHECGALQLGSLYLIWDGAAHIPLPSLKHLQYPTALKDLTVYAPDNIRTPRAFRPWGELYVPATEHCPNLVYVTYAADRTPIPTVASLCDEAPHLKGTMFVLVNISEQYVNEDTEDALVKDDKEMYPNFSTAYLRFSSQVLGQWLEKMEGRPSVLEHPPPRSVDDGE